MIDVVCCLGKEVRMSFLSFVGTVATVVCALIGIVDAVIRILDWIKNRSNKK